jgi:hypothetical protein
MDQSKISKFRAGSHLLPPPGGEVVRNLLDEIEKLQAETCWTPCCLFDIEAGTAFNIPETGQVYVRSDGGFGVASIQCVRVLPDVGIEVLSGGLRVCQIKLNIKWEYV